MSAMPSPNSPVLQELNQLDASSLDFHSKLYDLLYGKDYIQCVPNLQGGDPAWLVDYLDGVLGALDPSSPTSRKCLRELKSICGTRKILPTSYTISHPLNISPDPFARGGFGDVYQGILDGSKVCIKRVRVYTQDDPQKATKAFCREAAMWKRLTHPNILHLLGITITPLQLISEWMSGGELRVYIKNNSNANQLGLTCGVAMGLCYLHSCNVIHGDLKGPNILVDDSGHARIVDFGFTTVTQNLDSIPSISLQRGHSMRWTAPEVLNGGKYSKEADIFSFSMVMLEVFVGAVPFSDSSATTAMVYLIQGKRPPRPTHPTFTEDLWTLMQRCWDHNSSLRPKAPEVLEVLTLSVCKRLTNQALITHERIHLITTIFSDRDLVRMVKHISGDYAQTFIDVIDRALDSLAPEIRRRCLASLYRICGRQGLVPRSLVLPLCYDPKENPLFQGEFTDVWKGKHRGREVAARVLRMYSIDDPEQIRRRFCREVVAWKSLHHLNVLPLLGVTIMKNRFVMVSEWMKNGNINEFVKRHTNANRLELLRDATRGLIYMHDQGIIHGNLRGANILIDDNGRACLADFGLLTIISDEPTVASTTIGTTIVQWASPELLVPDQFGLKESNPTKASDCYALGMVIYEVLSGRAPFAQYSFLAVVWRVLEGERPTRPQEAQGSRFTDNIWRTLELCWKPQPGDRISAKTVLHGLEENSSPLGTPTILNNDLTTDDGYQSDVTSDDSAIPDFQSDDGLLD
ncbi:kinase-like protein [Thelephora ganbajun]|uniref:Kinase-like protein n=1 Tax=Thelephora ganbajun TaxID=370292 RepID=A0ACB6YYC5_THEGA|nr:kinase-like protein [Thelephora ganbajun]